MTANNLILVIESKPAPNDLTLILKQAGYYTLSTDNVDTVIETIRARKPLLLIANDASDKSLSVEICRNLRTVENLNSPLICLVGKETSYSNEVHLKLGTNASEYIETPLEPLKVIRKITSLIERRRTKESLEEKDIVFRSLIESITDIITVISIEGAVLYESMSVERILGRKPVDTLGVNAFDWIHPHDRQKVIDYILTSDYDDAARGIEYRIKHQNGSWRIFHSVGRFNKSILKTKAIVITSRDVTNRNLLAERHQIALEKARMVWWEWNPHKDKVSISDNFGEIYGVSNINNSIKGFNVVHPDDHKRHRKLVKGIVKNGGSYHDEFRIIRKDNGKTVWIEETATAILNELNEVEQLVGISVDISERKKAENDLRESEEKFKALFKGIPIPVYIWRKLETADDFILIDSNDAGDQQTTSFSSRYFGMKASELLDDEPEIINGLNRCSGDQEIVHIEAEYHHQETGELKILDLYFVCISPTLVMVVSRDITEIQVAEEERLKLVAQIEFQNQRLNDIITSVPGAVWESRIVGDITEQGARFVSDYIEKLTGYTKEEWLSHPSFWLEIMHPDDRSEAIEKSNAFFKGENEGFLEYRFLTKSGDIVWTETQMKLVKDHLGNVISLNGITIDVTKRKDAENALSKSEEQLRLSQKLESVGRLAGGIAHDFNNMLTAINGYSELILRELKEDSSIRQKVLEIKKAGERSASLTQQLLAFSRRQILKPQLIDLNQIVKEMSDLLRRLIGEHIELTIELAQTQCRVEADPGQLSQVIMNLVVNARDAMPDGGKLTIKTANVQLGNEFAIKYIPTIPGNYVQLTVSDTGTGVDDEIIENIFEPFYTTKEKGLGTGLGLATVYGIVKQSGGYIWVEGEKDKGATFDIYLPQIEDQLKVPFEKVEAETELSGTETILLVEDEDAVRELTIKILEIYGYNVIEATDGLEAFEIFKKSSENISLLITDIVMPRMSGRELAEKVNQLNPDVRVLFSSGYSDDRNMMHGTDDKSIDFINKPFNSDELGLKVRTLLDK